jgi:hypothetical protein
MKSESHWKDYQSFVSKGKAMKKSELTLDMYSEMMYEAPYNDIPANEQVECKEEYDTLMLMGDTEFQDAMEAVKNPYSAAAANFEIHQVYMSKSELDEVDITDAFEYGCKQHPGCEECRRYKSALVTMKSS